MEERLIKSRANQTTLGFLFLEGMTNRMDVSFFRYGDYKKNYIGQYTAEFLKDVSATLRGLVARWKGKGTSANGNAVMFCLERLLLYLDGGQTRGGQVSRGNTEYLMDSANGLMIEFTCPQVPGARFEAGDAEQSPGFSGLSEQERKEFKEKLGD